MTIPDIPIPDADTLIAAYPDGLSAASAFYACDGPREQQERELRRIIAACATWPTDEARDLGLEAWEHLDDLLSADA